ncbi:MAG TPA: hypothetical protein DIW64_00720 [Cellvibrio sp.]|nr:hypothetical protein [Cellvibrio sp.]
MDCALLRATMPYQFMCSSKGGGGDFGANCMQMILISKIKFNSKIFTRQHKVKMTKSLTH